MLHENLPVVEIKLYLVNKDKEVKERNIYFFSTNDNVINICKYAKSEGADYIYFIYNGHQYFLQIYLNSYSVLYHNSLSDIKEFTEKDICENIRTLCTKVEHIMNINIKKIDSITLDDIKKIASNCYSNTEIVMNLCDINELEPQTSNILDRLICHIEKIKYDNEIQKSVEILIPIKSGKDTTLSNIIIWARILRISSKYSIKTKKK